MFLFAIYKSFFFHQSDSVLLYITYFTNQFTNVAYKVPKISFYESADFFLLHILFPISNVSQSELFRNEVNIDSHFEEQIMSWHLVLSFCQMLGQS